MIKQMTFVQKFYCTLALSISLWTIFLPQSVVLAAQPQTIDSTNIEAEVLSIIRAHPDVLIGAITAYQSEQENQRTQDQSQALERFKQSPTTVLGQSPAIGAGHGKLLLVEFSDFECPFCAKAHIDLQKLVADRSDVQLVYKHLPLVSIHAQAMPAALAAWAAAQQGKFWQYHDALFAHQSDLGEPLYLDIARTLELNLNQFDRDRRSNAALSAVRADVDLANRLGISGTPSFVVSQNQTVELFSGSDLSPIKAVLDHA